MEATKKEGNNTQGQSDTFQGDNTKLIKKEVRKGGYFSNEDAKVFVGNLSYSTSWQNLKDHMKTAGEVIYVDIFKRPDGKSKGCGIVEYKSTPEAERAIKELHETKLDGRQIYVRENKREERRDDREDREVREDRQDRGGFGFRKERGGFKEKGYQIFVKNIAWSVRWPELKDAFREFGSIIRADVPQDAKGRSSGFGIITFEHEQDAREAINKMNGSIFRDRKIIVEMKDEGRNRQ